MAAGGVASVVSGFGSPAALKALMKASRSRAMSVEGGGLYVNLFALGKCFAVEGAYILVRSYSGIEYDQRVLLRSKNVEIFLTSGNLISVNDQPMIHLVVSAWRILNKK